MKYGLIYFDETDNIGDDIQSYAVMQFLCQIDYLIDRERMNEFASGSQEPVAVVLSGWFLHKKFNWPPSKDIYPFCTSLHFSANDYMGIGYDFLDGLGGEYLKNYGSVGCRDTSTLEILRKKGIPSYLSGCATLTLPKREKKENGNYICLVDVSDEVFHKVFAELQGTDIEIRQLTHAVDYANNPLEWHERISKVEKLLDTYQNAKCVITKRLHCALPCLAFNTPVLLLLDKDKDDVSRYSHFVELLHVTSTAKFLDGNANFTLSAPPENKKKYMSESRKLSEAIRNFICQVQKNQIKSSFNTWKEVDDRRLIRWQVNISTQAALYASNQVDMLLREKNQIEADRYVKLTKMSEQYDQDTTTLKQYLAKLEAEIKRLNNVILEKSADANRLDDVVLRKDQEILRINQIIQKKELSITEMGQELSRINQILKEKETTIHKKECQIQTINQTVQVKEHHIQELNMQIVKNKKEIDYWMHIFNQIDELIQYKEEHSITWLLFHSKKYKNLKFIEKFAALKRAVFKTTRKKNHFLEDLSEDAKKNIL